MVTLRRAPQIQVILLLLLGVLAVLASAAGSSGETTANANDTITPGWLQKLKSIFDNLKKKGKNHGCHKATAPPPPPPPYVMALELATSNWKAQATRSFVESGIAAAMETLCRDSNGEFTQFATAKDIAKMAGLQPEATYRFLRYLTTLANGQFCVEGNDYNFQLGPVGQVLTPHHPKSVANAILWEASETPTVTWLHLTHFLKTGEKATQLALGVDNVFDYFAQRPELIALFSRAMTGFTNEQVSILTNPDLTPTLDLSPYKTICDLGTAEGRLGMAMTTRFPHAQYILADLPEVVARIDAKALPPNVSIHPTNFLKQSPPKADAYLLKAILHDWSDDHCHTILQHVKAANPRATIFVFEMGPMPGPNVPHLTKGFDIHMGVVAGGKERTQEQYDALWATNGYQRVATHFLANGEYPLYIQELVVVDGDNSTKEL